MYSGSVIIIRNREYDVTEFIKEHPGGSIIKYLINSNEDATDAYNAFHARSKKADLVLKSLPSVPRRYICPDAIYKLTLDFRKLSKELKDEGYFEPDIIEVTYRIFELIGLFIMSLYIYRYSSICGIFIYGIFSGRCGWLMHEAGHYSLTGNIKIDRYLQAIIYGFGCGMSGKWWRTQHNKHHACPQKLKHDVDLDTLPLVAFNGQISKKVKNKWLKKWLNYQMYTFVPIICGLVALSWQLYLHPKSIYKRLSMKSQRGYCFSVVELISMMSRYVLIFIYSFYTSRNIWIDYFIGNSIAAMYIFTNFSLSHTHLPITSENTYLNWVYYASNHTTNLKHNIFTTWWMGNLNFQIEHHLFPSMPQYRHKYISPRVKKLFESNGLKYDNREYFTCLKDTFQNLNKAGYGG